MPFALDSFQSEAFDALDDGASVLVSAPTGSGKTLVAEYALQLALEAGSKSFYTTPIKALSNQKFVELCARHGAGRIGLLTGDVSHQGDAPIVVMTTEVLRNMLFTRSPALDGLAVVVLDEVHYLQDPYRGSVWEEILVLTPPEVRFVSLSATVSNAEDFGMWLTSVCGPTRVVVERNRPVTLHHHYAVSEKGVDGVHAFPLFDEDGPNPLGRVLDERRHRHRHRRHRTPRRGEVVEYLRSHGLLPAITFIFSRAACDAATRQCLEDGIRLTTPDERHRIRGIVEAAVERPDDDDLRTLRYGEWSDALESGIAPHHAGLVPAYRQAAERCFSAGLLKVVFATETLALGINMPARTVVMERFTKHRGAVSSALTAGEYQQLTGRAGRRGIDTVGHALTLWSPTTRFEDVATTALSPPPALVSSFHPTYNLAVNLVRRWSREHAHALVASSYGQWQARDHSRSLSEQLDRRLAILESRGFVDGWRLTASGAVLASIYHESDLLVAEALGSGILDGLDPASLGGVLSAFTFEDRRPKETAARRLDGAILERLARLEVLATDLRRAEERFGLRCTRRPDGGLVAAVGTWVRGATLEQVLVETEIAPGDFVRAMRQLLDLTSQVSEVAGDLSTRRSARRAVALIRRGVVATDDPTS